MKGTVFLPDGTACSGKSTYSRKMAAERGAVLFIMDEIMIRYGAMSPEAFKNILDFVRDTTVQIANAGTDVVLEHGYFNKADRDEMKKYFKDRDIPFEWHFLDVSQETWRKNIAKRNAAHDAGETLTFYISEDTVKLFESSFNPPSREEVDVWIDNNY